jgi:hypothetical protein
MIAQVSRCLNRKNPLVTGDRKTAADKRTHAVEVALFGMNGLNFKLYIVGKRGQILERLKFQFSGQKTSTSAGDHRSARNAIAKVQEDPFETIRE